MGRPCRPIADKRFDMLQVQMLDHVVTLMYSGDQGKRNLAHEVLTKVAFAVVRVGEYFS